MGPGVNMFKLSPFIVEKTWGSTYFNEYKNVDKSSLVGETWEISALENESSYIDDSTLNQFSEKIGNLKYLVKLLTASENLSVQIHPDDEMARSFGLPYGKDECWLILDSAPGSGIYRGLKEGVSFEQVKKAIEEEEDLSELLIFVSVKRGDFIDIPAGTIHCVGAGVNLLEIQSDMQVTYRFWDWNRRPKRELHIKNALASLKKDLVFRDGSIRKKNDIVLIDHKLFRVRYLKNQEVRIKNDKRERSASLVCLSGNIHVQSTQNAFELKQFESGLISINEQGDIDINGKTGEFVLVE